MRGLRKVLARRHQSKTCAFLIHDGVADDENARSLVVNGDVARRVTGRRDDREVHDVVTSTDRHDRPRRADVRDVRGSSVRDGVGGALEGTGQPDPVIRVLMRHDHRSDSRPVEADRRQPTLDHVRPAPGSGVDDRRLAASDEDVARERASPMRAQPWCID